MRPLVVRSGRSAVAGVVMSAAVASCVAGVHETAPRDGSPSMTPDGGAEVRFDMMPVDLASPIERFPA